MDWEIADLTDKLAALDQQIEADERACVRLAGLLERATEAWDAHQQRVHELANAMLDVKEASAERQRTQGFGERQASPEELERYRQLEAEHAAQLARYPKWVAEVSTEYTDGFGMLRTWSSRSTSDVSLSLEHAKGQLATHRDERDRIAAELKNAEEQPAQDSPPRPGSWLDRLLGV